MAESVPVRCPSCRREHSYTPNTYPCACGSPLTPRILRGGSPVRVEHHTWEDTWVTVRCDACGRRSQWPRPELGCPCGLLLRLPVAPLTSASPAVPGSPAEPPRQPAPTSAVPRPAFRPVTIRTGRDAVNAAAKYLRWLGFRDVLACDDRPGTGVDLRGTGVVAQVDPTTRPSALREVECLWLNGLNASAVGVFFSLAGYAHDARTRADELLVPLFVMDLTGTPQPVNDSADDLIRMGA
ncbi:MULTISPECIES: hypothetical protein [Streptomyces]|uniref:Restriction endonuclease type IV Mrr domain-containing protein n=2 Tax=Streptomyces TaxID=1883 RepID=A0A420UY81_9ACTN|nr:MULTISPECIES: hypothetical protein [Streptomyces]KNE81989.1 hypothetical protein ADZ36_13270 [Streptomyces fradiae]OFA51448.1 hypothetical protein BEN35_14015 [Streptomyces fradiae]PQM19445.1 hypothetical protein Sfr7A_32135 [Streptomyces xinghaiensis]RKM92789.1 hypothetical protein SFRA_022965 [Streptomyces xinghaiensis]RNC69132.1 hypothetical protein DC095_030555 [Streptomyces xinghaiensis]